VSKRVLLISTFQEGAYAHVIKHTLRKHNYKVYTFDHRLSIDRHGLKATNDFLKLYLCRLEPDYMLVLKGRGIDEKIIKDAPCKTINWWLDHHKRYVDFEKYYDVYDVVYLCEEGQGYPWMPIGIEPDIHRPIPSSEGKWQSDVVFAGTGHIRRGKRIYNIMRNMPWNCKIWGNSWNPNIPIWQGGAIYWDKLMKAYTNAKIILNAHYVKGITPNMRCFEAPASGTMMLSDTGKGLEECFKAGKEFVPYDTEKEAKQLIAKYLEEEEERIKIGKAGYERVISDHLLINRLERMFDAM